MRLPAQAARQLPDQSTTLAVSHELTPTVRIAFLHALLESDLAGIGVAPAPIAGPSARQRGTGALGSFGSSARY
jgi:hypothetical protein